MANRLESTHGTPLGQGPARGGNMLATLLYVAVCIALVGIFTWVILGWRDSQQQELMQQEQVAAAQQQVPASE